MIQVLCWFTTITFSDEFLEMRETLLKQPLRKVEDGEQAECLLTAASVN